MRGFLVVEGQARRVAHAAATAREYTAATNPAWCQSRLLDPPRARCAGADAGCGAPLDMNRAKRRLVQSQQSLGLIDTVPAGGRSPSRKRNDTGIRNTA